MKKAMYWTLCVIFFAGLFVACEKEAVETMEPVQDTELQLRLDDGGGVGVDCIEASEEGLCDCEYKIDYIKWPKDEWRLYMYGDAHTSCCKNGERVKTLDLSDDCGGTNLAINQWKDFNCNLGDLQYLRFESSSECNSSCDYRTNILRIRVRCNGPFGVDEKAYFVYANLNEGCAEPSAGSTAISVSPDCQLD